MTCELANLTWVLFTRQTKLNLSPTTSANNDQQSSQPSLDLDPDLDPDLERATARAALH